MIHVGLHGINGHQIHESLVDHKLAVLSAVSAFPEEKLPERFRESSSVQRCGSLEELILIPHIDCVVLCSPRRCDQARDAILALHAGKHVLAEKPCAMTEDDLDAVIAASLSTGKVFHEMAGTAFGQPYFGMRKVVLSGQLGQVVQVIAEKSYPYHEGRPQDEAIDGGQIGQNAIHALRWVEHVAATPIRSIQAVETKAGNPVSQGGLVMAANLTMTLQNGGVAAISSNYLNPPGTGIWGNESLKILGTRGFVESRAGGQSTRLVIDDEDFGSLDTSDPGFSWMDGFFSEITDRTPFPISLEEELSPTRWAIRAKTAVPLAK